MPVLLGSLLLVFPGITWSFSADLDRAHAEDFKNLEEDTSKKITPADGGLDGRNPSPHL